MAIVNQPHKYCRTSLIGLDWAVFYVLANTVYAVWETVFFVEKSDYVFIAYHITLAMGAPGACWGGRVCWWSGMEKSTCPILWLNTRWPTNNV